jgi:ATP-dependent Clp protease ATP-binding subunit ClpA
MKLSLRRRPQPRFMSRAMPFVAAAASASRRLGYDYIGTEHLLLALAEDHNSTAARALANLHLAPDQIRTDIVRFIGPCESARKPLDADALATLGIDLDEVRSHLEQTFGPGALERTRAGCTPLMPRLKRAFELAARDAGDGPIRSEHVLVAVASVKDSAAAHILANHDITVNELRASITRHTA